MMHIQTNSMAERKKLVDLLVSRGWTTPNMLITGPTKYVAMEGNRVFRMTNSPRMGDPLTVREFIEDILSYNDN